MFGKANGASSSVSISNLPLPFQLASVSYLLHLIIGEDAWMADCPWVDV